MIGFDINSYEFECEKKTKHLLKQHNCEEVLPQTDI